MIVNKIIITGVIFSFISVSSSKSGYSVSANSTVHQKEASIMRKRKIEASEEKKKSSSENGSESNTGDFSVQESRDFVDLIGTKIIHLLQDKRISRDEQEKRYRQILDEHFDMQAISLYTLGKFRHKATPKELKEFIELFTKLTVENYVDQFNKYKNQSLVLKHREYKKGPYLVVASYIDQKEGKNIDVQWYIKRNSTGNLAVYELVVEGVGLKKTKRNIFSSTLQNSGIQGLMVDLKRELDQYNGLGKKVHH